MSLPSHAVSEPAPRWWQRFSPYSDFWVRFLDWGVRRCPFFIEPSLVCGYTTLFFLLAGQQRRAMMDNLSVLCPHASRAGRFFRTWAVFWEFAWMIADSARARSGERHVTWRLDGVEAFSELSGGGGAALILTAHMGNYDVAGPFFADKLGRPLHGVRVPERRAELQNYMDRQRQAGQTEGFRVRYNQPGSFLGVELAQALAAGEVVAIQGDRVVGGVSPVEVIWRGRVWLLPAGPFVLAQAAAAPIFPIFILRERWRSYRILVLPPRRPAASPVGRVDRAAARHDLLTWWSGVLGGVIEKYWAQWLVFEPAFGESVVEVDGDPRPVVASTPLVSEPLSRPEGATPEGLRPAFHPISRTAFGRLLNARGLFLPLESSHMLRAEDSAQNVVETWVLAAFSAGFLAVVAWLGLSQVMPWPVAAVLVGPATFFLLETVPLLLGALAAGMKKVGLLPSGWSLVRATEELFFLGQTGFSVWLVRTGIQPLAILGWLWLGLTAVNLLSTVVFWLLVRRRR